MTFRRRLLTLLGVAVVFAPLSLAAGAHAADPPTYTIAPNLTDPAIIDPPPPARHAREPPGLARARGRTGSTSCSCSCRSAARPTCRRSSRSSAARARASAITRSSSPTATRRRSRRHPPDAGAGIGPLPPAPAGLRDQSARMEILNGTGRTSSPGINVNVANSIENRLNKLLAHLADDRPRRGLGAVPRPRRQRAGAEWSETVIAGGSLGAGAGRPHRGSCTTSTVRCCSPAGPTPTTAGSSSGMTRQDSVRRADPRARPVLRRARASCTPTLVSAPTSRWTWRRAARCPTSQSRRPTRCSTNRRAAVRQRAPRVQPHSDQSAARSPDPFHPSTVARWLPRQGRRRHRQQLVNAWRSVLGDKDADTCLDLKRQLPELGAPTRDQTDTDRNELGDACDPTPARHVPPAISVPARSRPTLTARQFGAFVATRRPRPTTSIRRPRPRPCTNRGPPVAIGTHLARLTATDASANAADRSRSPSRRQDNSRT